MVFFAIAVLQAAVMVTITYAGRGTPGEDGFFLVGSLELFIAIALLACVSALIGLTISAVVRSAEQTMPPLVLVVMVQLVFCGGMFPLAGRTGLEQLAWLFPGRWGYSAAAIGVDLTTISPLAPQTQEEPLWEQTATNTFLSYGSHRDGCGADSGHLLAADPQTQEPARRRPARVAWPDEHRRDRPHRPLPSMFAGSGHHGVRTR